MKKIILLLIATLLQVSNIYANGQYQILGFSGNVAIEQNGKWNKIMSKAVEIKSDSKFRISENSSIKIKSGNEAIIYDKTGIVTLSQIIEESDKSFLSNLLNVLFGEKETAKASAYGATTRGDDDGTGSGPTEEETASAIYKLVKQIIGYNFKVFNKHDLSLSKIAEGDSIYHYAVENKRNTAIYFTILEITPDNNVEFCFNIPDKDSQKAPLMRIEAYSSVDLDFAKFAGNGNKSILLATAYPFTTYDLYKLFENRTDPKTLKTKNIDISFYLLK